MINIKNIALFILCLIPWFLTFFIPVDKNFYNSLILPFFTPSNTIFKVLWITTYISITISIYKILTTYKVKEITKDYKKILIINYLCNQSFMIMFFLLKNTFLGFISSITTFISSLFLYEETNNLDEESTKYLNPYVLLTLFTTVLSITIYIINTK